MLRLPHLATLTALALLLSGCSPSVGLEPSEKPSASPSADEPLFASEEEAVAAADAVIQEYWRVTNDVFRAGGAGAENFASVVTPRRFESESKLARTFSAQQLVQTGGYTATGVAFQQSYKAQGETILIVTACVDRSDVEIVAPSGEQVVFASPDPRRVHQVTLRANGTFDNSDLRLDKSEPWDERTC